MHNCNSCKHSEWDYNDDFHGFPHRQWIFEGCDKDVEPGFDGECEEYEEIEQNEN